MKRINTYIIEKLHLNKDIKIDTHKFNEDEICLFVNIFEYFTRIEIRTRIIKFKQIKNNHIFYQESFISQDNDLFFTDNIAEGDAPVKNKKGFYTFLNRLRPFNSFELFLNTNDAIIFLEKINNIDINTLNSYCNYDFNYNKNDNKKIKLLDEPKNLQIKLEYLKNL